MGQRSTETTYYQRGAPPPPRPASAPARLQTRVCIVGGGFAGLATALGLIERGVRDLVVLEAEDVGHGASGRNGGFVFGGYSLGPYALLRQLGPADARAAYQLTLEAMALIRRRIDRHGIACDRVDSGVLLADWFDDPVALRQLQQTMARDFGAEWEWLSREQTQERLRTRRYHAALREPRAFHFHPLRYVQGLQQVLQAAGVSVLTGQRVQRLERQGATTTVHTAQLQVQAEHTVLCCGGYLDGLLPALARAMLPIATYVMATEPLGDRLREVVRGDEAVYDTRFAFDYYRPLPDTRLLWGGRISVRSRRPEAVRRLLLADLLKVYPQLQGVRIDHAWSGLMSYGRHQMPQIGRLPDGTWYAMGFGGHGVAPTSVAGELLAQAIAHGTALPPPWPRYGLAFTGGPLGLAAAQASYWYYQLLDWWRA